MSWLLNSFRFSEAAAYLLQATFTAGNGAWTGTEGVEDGSFTTVQTDGSFDILSNALDITAPTVSGWGKLGFYSNTITRSRGVGLILSYTPDETTTYHKICGFKNAPSITNTTFDGKHLYFINTGTINVATNAVVGFSTGAYLAGTEYKMACLLGGYSSETPWNGEDAGYAEGNALFIYKSGNWILEWKDSDGSTATVYAGNANHSQNGTMDNYRVPTTDLSSLLVPNNLSTTVTTADTFTHIADCYIESKITTLPSSGNLDIEFRRQDDSNKWIYRVTSAGAVSLVEVVATVEATRVGPVASAVANGDVVTVIASGTTISIFSGATKDGSYASATNFATDTGGKIVFGSGAVAHLADWSRGNDAAYSDLDSY